MSLVIFFLTVEHFVILHVGFSPTKIKKQSNLPCLLYSASCPRVLDDLGLATALERLVSEWQLRYKIPVDVEIQLTGRLPGEVETAVYHIVQETLTNMACAGYLLIHQSFEKSKQ